VGWRETEYASVRARPRRKSTRPRSTQGAWQPLLMARPADIPTRVVAPDGPSNHIALHVSISHWTPPTERRGRHSSSSSERAHINAAFAPLLFLARRADRCRLPDNDSKAVFAGATVIRKQRRGRKPWSSVLGVASSCLSLSPDRCIHPGVHKPFLQVTVFSKPTYYYILFCYIVVDFLIYI
jgi:hypothetical protein